MTISAGVGIAPGCCAVGDGSALAVQLDLVDALKPRDVFRHPGVYHVNIKGRCSNRGPRTHSPFCLQNTVA